MRFLEGYAVFMPASAGMSAAISTSSEISSINGIGAIGLEGPDPRFLNYEAQLADGPECHGNFDDSLALSLENTIPPGGNPTSATYGFFTVNEFYGQSAATDQTILAETVLNVDPTQTVDSEHDTATVQSATGPGIQNELGAWYFTLDGQAPPPN